MAGAALGQDACVRLLTIVTSCGLVASPFVCLWLAATGVAETAAAIVPRLARSGSRPSLPRAVVKLVAVPLLVAAPFVAVDRAEQSNDWVDVDGNGFLDPMANGSYDWFDVNGGDFLRYGGALSLVVMAATAVGVRLTGEGGADARQEESATTPAP